LRHLGISSVFICASVSLAEDVSFLDEIPGEAKLTKGMSWNMMKHVEPINHKMLDGLTS